MFFKQGKQLHPCNCFSIKWYHQESNDSNNTHYTNILQAHLRASPTHFNNPSCCALRDSILPVRLPRKGSKIFHLTKVVFLNIL